MNIICLDLEFSQPEQEIIQVGYCIGNINSGAIIEQIRAYPEMNFNIHINDFIQKLTGVTEDHLIKQGRPLRDIYREMEYLAKKHSCFSKVITWGGGDLFSLKQQANIQEKGYFATTHLDVKGIFQSYCLVNNKKTQSGLGKSLRRLGMEFKGRAHDALDDAINTFYVYKRLLEELKIT